jgi:translation initiation factor 5B
MERKIRQPILAVLGHVDHGKTTLLDKVRGTVVAKGEAGLITQAIGATNIPITTIKNICGSLMEKAKVELTIPGLLIIDTPGHEAFTTLRKRGGAIADMAILVVDINEGFKPQTEESLNFLKQFKTPFIVAATKIDKVAGWNPRKDSAFLASFKDQTERVQDDFEKKLYDLIGQLSMRGFEAERYDRISDYTKQIAIVPVSGVTGEGIIDILMVLCGVAQKYLKEGLEVKPGEGKGTVLEVKDFKGLGTTLDVILYDGQIGKGDWLIIGGNEVITTKVKALLEPSPLKEMRVEKMFRTVNTVSAAAGVKIAAPSLEKVTAGSPVRAVRDRKDVDRAIKEVQSEIEEVEIETDKEGVLLKADTLGSLEALIKSLKGIVPIRKAEVGNVTKADIMEIRNFDEPKVFAFSLKVPADVEALAKDNKVAMFSSDVIYTLIEDYKKWEQDRKKRAEEEMLEAAVRPGRVRVLPGFVFRQKKPAVFGVEVEKGIVKPGYRLRKGSKVVGEIKEIQLRGSGIAEAKMGDKVALSMPDVTVGKDVKEGDTLDVFLTKRDLSIIEKIKDRMGADELELLEESE